MKRIKKTLRLVRWAASYWGPRAYFTPSVWGGAWWATAP